eukprot:9460964-Alexandrium_andersonii.AAC.1
MARLAGCHHPPPGRGTHPTLIAGASTSTVMGWRRSPPALGRAFVPRLGATGERERSRAGERDAERSILLPACLRVRGGVGLRDGAPSTEPSSEGASGETERPRPPGRRAAALEVAFAARRDPLAAAPAFSRESPR